MGPGEREAKAYKIRLQKSAEKELSKLSPDICKRIIQKIDLLSLNPFPPGVKKLSDEHDLYRIRVGDYRIIYQVENNILVIIVVKIGHRREVYRK